jgi:hypothetical protein
VIDLNAGLDPTYQTPPQNPTRIEGLAWHRGHWVRTRSSIPLGLRVVIYLVVAVGLYLPIMYGLTLLWGLQGAAWEQPEHRPTIGDYLLQPAITIVTGLFVLIAAALLRLIDRRDWWLGILVGLPWLLTSAGLLYGFLLEPESLLLVLAALGVAIAVGALIGSAVAARVLD